MVSINPQHVSEARFPLNWLCPIVFAFVLSMASTATASEGDASLSVASGFTQVPREDAGMQFGPGIQALAIVDLSDFFALRAGASTSYLFPREFSGRQTTTDGFSLQNVFFGLRYNLDIFEYVPYVALSVVLHQRGPPPALGEPPRATLGAKASVGLDWRFTRFWSVGGRAELHSIASNARTFPAMASLQAVLSYHFRL